MEIMPDEAMRFQARVVTFCASETSVEQNIVARRMRGAKFGPLNASDDFLRARRIGECNTLKLETDCSVVCYRMAI
jgi:hypothetical protein